MASTNSRWPSIKRGSDVRWLALRRFGSGISGLTGMVKTLAIYAKTPTKSTQMQVKAPTLRGKEGIYMPSGLVLFGLSCAPIILHQGMRTFAINIFLTVA